MPRYDALCYGHRARLQSLASLYCELGQLTFDFVDGRIRGRRYMRRREQLARAIREALEEMMWECLEDERVRGKE